MRLHAYLSGLWLFLVALGVSPSATAQAPELTPPMAAGDRPRLLGNFRLRYEHAEEGATPKDATALTLRYRGAIEWPIGPRLVAFAEVEASEDPIDTFNDGRENWSDRLERPVILDPDGRELNRFQLQAELAPGKRITLGRQRIILDDERFIGVSAFRQNDRTFDAARLSADLPARVLLDAAYLRRTHRVLGADSPFGVFAGDSWLVNLNAPTPLGRIALFHYALDLSTGPEGARTDKASSQTSGLRVSGRRHWAKGGLRWEAAYARQRDYADNPVDYRADYRLLGLTYEREKVTFSVRGEVLGASDGEKGFQTPLATLRKFQGNADVFFLTPADGVRDLALGVDWRPGRIGALPALEVFARHHRFWADRDGRRYGTEWDVGVSVGRNRTRFDVALARYRSQGYASDVDRLVLSISQIF